MGKRTMHDNDIRYIDAIARMHSISAAAEELGVSQPTLSVFLKKAEQRLGAPIFDRASNPLSLTAAGAAYLDYCKEADRLERRLLKQVSDINELETGELVVGGTASFNMTLLPKAVLAFSERFPGVEVSVVADTLPNLAQASLDGDIDVFIATSLQDNGSFACIELAQERFFLCVPSSWPICGRLPLPGVEKFATIGHDEFAQLSDCTFITMHDDQQSGRKLAELMDHYGVEPAHTITVDQALTAVAFTGEGLGISLVTELALECANPRIKPALYVPDVQTCVRTLYAAMPSNRTAPRAAEEFVRILKDSLN